MKGILTERPEWPWECILWSFWNFTRPWQQHEDWLLLRTPKQRMRRPHLRQRVLRQRRPGRLSRLSRLSRLHSVNFAELWTLIPILRLGKYPDVKRNWTREGLLSTWKADCGLRLKVLKSLSTIRRECSECGSPVCIDPVASCNPLPWILFQSFCYCQEHGNTRQYISYAPAFGMFWRC